MRELTPAEQLIEIKDEFIVEAFEFRVADPLQRESILAHINALLDAYLDMWPELIED